jgi:hypothetical protein
VAEHLGSGLVKLFVGSERGDAMKDRLKKLLLVQAVALLLAGVPMFLVPGRLLEVVGWAPIDPIVSRLLGAALLSMAWAALRQGAWVPLLGGMAARDEERALYALLGCVGMLRHLLFAHWPWYAWAVLAGHVLLLAVSCWALLEERRA